jgi:PAS domain S-box-containing protein
MVTLRSEAAATTQGRSSLLVTHDPIERQQRDLTRARLAAIVQSSADSIIGSTLDGIITDWNPGAERLYGYTADEAIGRPLAILAPPERARQIDELLERVRQGESIAEVEVVARARGGKRFDISLTISPVRDDAGQIVACSAIARDISARKVAEAERLATHQHTRQVLERITDGFFALDLDWRFTYVNEAAERLAGQNRDALLGTSLWEAFPDILETPIATFYQRTIADGVPASIEFYYPPLGLWIDAMAYPSPDGLSVFFRDVTASRRMEQDVRASEEKYRTLMDQIPAAVYVLSPSGNELPLYLSPYFSHLTGFSPEEAMAREHHWLDEVHPDDRARVAAEEALAMAANAPLRIEYRFRRKDGSYIWVLDDSVLLHDENGTVVANYGVLLDISERVRANEERARLAAIVESTQEGILSCTLDGIITSWNHGAEKLYGYRVDEAIGQTVMILRPPGEVDDIALLTERVRRGESIEGYETVRMTRTGRRITVSLTLSPLRDATGHVVGIASISRDVTALRQAEEALRLRDRALAAAPNAIVITEPAPPSVRIVDVNPAFEAMTGYTREEVIGQDIRMLFGPGTDPHVGRRIGEAIAAGDDVTETLLNYRKDGSPYWIELHVAPVRDDAGALTHLVGIQTDITERVQAEAALRESEARFRGVWESTLDAMALADAAGIVLAANPAYCELSGYPMEEIVGHNFSRIFPADERAEREAGYQAIFASPLPTASFETTIQRASGALREVACQGAFIEFDGQRQAMVVAIRDVTERNRLERELRGALQEAEAATRTKSLFLAMMSHELRTPLQAVLGYTDLLLLGSSKTLTREQNEDLGHIKQGADRMIGLIDQMLDLSRMEAGRMELAANPVDLASIIEQVRQDVTPQAIANAIDLVIDLPPALPPARGDPSRLRQILLNLAGNAVKFTDHGSVRITARGIDDEIEIAVSDTGIGISAEALPHIFEEFHQVDGSLTRRHGGAGLGLAIARRLAEQMGGRLTVSSQPGAGSTFTLHIPAARG